MSEIKIWHCEPDWIAATTAKEAQECLISHAGIDATDCPIDEWSEETPERMLELEFYTDDPDEEGFSYENAKTILFKEQLENLIKEGTKFPCFFASSEW